jgi:ferredoxin
MIESAALQPVLAWVRRAEPEVVELVCPEHPDPSRGNPAAYVIRLPGCLADLRAHVPLELLVLGAGTVVLRLDGCSRSSDARSRHAAAAGLTAALRGRAVVLAGGSTGSRRRTVLDAHRMPIARRALFLLPASDLPPLPPEHATAHQRLSAAVTTLAAGTTAALGDVDGPGLALAAEGCTASGVCVRACPEDALSLRPGGGSTELRFDPGRCSGCSLCIEICERNALSAGGHVAWSAVLHSSPIVLARITTTRCRRCRAEFHPEDDGATLCPVCAFRTAHPFGSALPPRPA